MESMSPSSIASLSSLLTPSESHAFQSFLSSINDSPEWNVPKDRQALTKATKDLMALDSHYENDIYTYNSTSVSQPHLSLLLPRPPNSDSSSRTPTPTSSASIFPIPSPTSSRQSNRISTSHSHPYPIPPTPRETRSQSQSQPLASSSQSPQIKSSQSQQKPTLLSASQKKANHIQSEQKRRANIRRGYEALCDCVPALREAIRQEEAVTITAMEDSPTRSTPGPIRGKRNKAPAKSRRDTDERLDGRAGPRSENVVLSKTIDYINDLLDERSTLLARLHRARSMLPAGHPALTPQRWGKAPNPRAESEGPLWEREWKGGHGQLGTIDDGDEDGDESS